jgi:SAM-dependent methyltransferase
MAKTVPPQLPDTGERMIPAGKDEVSVVFARHRFAYQYALEFVSGKDVVDIGCGTGYGCSLLAQKARRVVGIDYDAAAIAYCKTHYAAPNIEFMQEEATLPGSADQFDVAIVFQVIEHLPDPAGFLSRVGKIVRPGGTILLTTPNSRTGSAKASDNPFHVSEMNHAEFSRLISRSFADFRILGIGYASKNRLRSFLLWSPLYALGRALKRKSRLKKAAAGVMGMTRWRILEDAGSEESIDLLAVCRNS